MFILKHLSQCNDAYLPVACELLMEVIVMSSLCLWPLAQLLNTGQFPGSICANNLLVLSEKDNKGLYIWGLWADFKGSLKLYV